MPNITEFAPRAVWEVEEIEPGRDAPVAAGAADVCPVDLDDVKGGADGRPAQALAVPCGRQPRDPPATRFDEELRELRALPPGGPDGARPLHSFASGATYLGQWRGNARHGEGVQRWPDGARYAGRWLDDCAHGLGELRHPSGDTYTGQWQANKASGRGVYRDGKGLATYSGDWVEDLQHGYGTERRVSEYHCRGQLVLSGASQYHGQYVMGCKDGYGVFEWADTSRYCGHWRKNVIEGAGHYVDPDKREFRGQWSNSLFHGMGKYTWPNGDTFCGKYQRDFRHGFGIFRSKYGKRSLGWWAEGVRNGGGVYYLSDGTLAREGVWENGNFLEEPPAKISNPENQ